MLRDGHKPVSRRVNEHISNAWAGGGETRRVRTANIMPERMPRAPLRSPRHQANAPCECTRGRAPDVVFCSAQDL
eukprot:623169-Prymnesium_polylepis.1